MLARIFINFLVCAVSIQGLALVPKISKNDLEKGALIDYSIVQKKNLGKGKMGQGSFGDIKKGFWKGIPVAIGQYNMKTLPPHLFSEYDIYSQLRHPYIVPFYGICDDPGKFWKVYKYHAYNLREYINGQNYKPNLGFIIPSARRLARVLSYMHSQSVAHKHLKSSNILLDENLLLKVTDFGLSKVKLESASSGASSSRPDATVRWRAPETFTREYAKVKDALEATARADIYAFGIILWEMRSGEKPFANMGEPEVVRQLTAKARPEIPNEWEPGIKEILTECWKDPKDRPSADALLALLEKKFPQYISDDVEITPEMQPTLVAPDLVSIVLKQDDREVQTWQMNFSELSGLQFASLGDQYRLEKSNVVAKNPLAQRSIAITPVLPESVQTKATKVLSQERSPLVEPNFTQSVPLENSNATKTSALHNWAAIKASEKEVLIPRYAGWNFSKAVSKNISNIDPLRSKEVLRELDNQLFSGQGAQLSLLSSDPFLKVSEFTASDWVIVRMEGVFLSTGYSPKGDTHYPFRATDREGISLLVALQNEQKFRLIFLIDERVREEDAKYMLGKVGFDINKVDIYREKPVGIGSIINELEEIQKYYTTEKTKLSMQKLRTIPQQILLFEPSMDAIRASAEKIKHDPTVIKHFADITFNLCFKENDRKLYDSSSSLLPENLAEFGFSREEDNIVVLHNKNTEYAFGAWLNPDEANEVILKKAILHGLYPESFTEFAVYNKLPNIEEVHRKFSRIRSKNMQSPGPYILLPYSKGVLQKEEQADRKFFIAHLILNDLSSDSHSLNLPGSKLDNPDAVSVHSSLDFHNYDSIWYDYQSFNIAKLLSVAKKLYPDWQNAESEIRVQAQDFINRHSAILAEFSHAAKSIQVLNTSELKTNLRHRLDHIAKIFSLDTQSSNYEMLIPERKALENYYQKDKNTSFNSGDPEFKKFYHGKTDIEYNELDRFLKGVYDVMKLSEKFIKNVIEALDPRYGQVIQQHFDADFENDRAVNRKLERTKFEVAKEFAAKIDLSELEMIIKSNPRATWNFYTLLYGDKWNPEKQQKLSKDIHDFVYSFSNYEAQYPSDQVVRRIRSLIGSRIMELIAKHQEVRTSIYEMPEDVVKLIFQDCEYKDLFAVSKSFSKSAWHAQIDANRLIEPQYKAALVGFTKNLTALTPVGFNDLLLGMFSNLKSLNLSKAKRISDKGFQGLTTLNELVIGAHTQFFGDGLNKLRNLRSLTILDNSFIEDHHLAGLTNLEHLKLGNTPKLKGDFLANLPNLKSLSIANNKVLDLTTLKGHRYLEYLDMGKNANLNDEILRTLIGLKELALRENVRVSDAGIITLNELTSLDLGHNSWVSDKGISTLKKLSRLKLGKNIYISDAGLAPLVNLESLELQENNRVLGACFYMLTNLISLDLGLNTNVAKSQDLNQLQKLEYLNVANAKSISPADLKLPMLKTLEIAENDHEISDGLPQLPQLKRLRNSNKIILSQEARRSFRAQEVSFNPSSPSQRIRSK